MGGPETENEFIAQVAHMHQCKVCRERAWAFLADMRKFANKLSQGLDKVLSGFVQSMAASGPPENDAEVEQLAAVAAQMTKTAVDRLIANPDKKEWDSEDLFGSGKMDDIPHLARCGRCRHVFDTLYRTAEIVLQKAKAAADSNTVSATERLLQWLRITRGSIQESMDAGGSSLGGNDNVRSFCS